MNAQKVYECGLCGEQYEHRDAADDCCRPSAVTVYKCSKCEETYLLKVHAEQCCCIDENEP